MQATIWIYFVIAIILIVIILNILQRFTARKYKTRIDDLDREKNLISSRPILNELEKIDIMVKNEFLNDRIENWHNRYNYIKDNKLPKINDMILEADYLVDSKEYKSALYKIIKVELELYQARENTNFLIKEIRELTLNEEKSREIITKMKATYRSLLQQFNSNHSNYGSVEEKVRLHFENIDARFNDFELALDRSEYGDVNTIVKVLEEMLKHLKVVIDEVPEIILMAETTIPSKSEEINTIYQTMKKEGYQLDYLNIEYNLEETKNKIGEILDSVRTLNLEDSVFELKTMSDYYESLFIEFEKERVNKDLYLDSERRFEKKREKTTNILNGIYNQIDDIKDTYNLNLDDLKRLEAVNSEIVKLDSDYILLKNTVDNNELPFTKLFTAFEELNNRIKRHEEEIYECLYSFGTLEDDEKRAWEQLEDIKGILSRTKTIIRNYKLPVIPDEYFVELHEATDAIAEIVKELDKKPITIKVLNTRVDTARDLVLKLYKTANEVVKTAKLAEMAIVYGNRFKPLEKTVEKGLHSAEAFFYKGAYSKALEASITTIDQVEPGIYKQLLKIYENKTE